MCTCSDGCDPKVCGTAVAAFSFAAASVVFDGELDDVVVTTVPVPAPDGDGAEDAVDSATAEVKTRSMIFLRSSSAAKKAMHSFTLVYACWNLVETAIMSISISRKFLDESSDQHICGNIGDGTLF